MWRRGRSSVCRGLTGLRVHRSRACVGIGRKGQMKNFRRRMLYKPWLCSRCYVRLIYPSTKIGASPPSYPYTSQVDQYLFRFCWYTVTRTGWDVDPCVVISFGKKSPPHPCHPTFPKSHLGRETLLSHVRIRERLQGPACWNKLSSMVRRRMGDMGRSLGFL